MTIRIITVGSKSSPAHQSIIDEYIKRLPKANKIEWLLVKHGSGDPTSSMTTEAGSILKYIPDSSYVILLDETGKQLSSPELSKQLSVSQHQDIALIIGGAYGVDDRVKERANFIWSLSKLVFPHQLVRVMLAEQLYRSYAISVNHPYHHD
jgi:23S rRNA (pseudouridine1915-N3)-methyltransferase